MGSELKLSDLPHKAVLWPAGGNYDDYGKPTTGTRVEINSRWEQGVRTSADALSHVGQVLSTVFVDREIAVNSLLWKGELDDIPNAPTGTVRVVEYKEVCDLKGNVECQWVMVVGHNDVIPAGA